MDLSSQRDGSVERSDPPQNNRAVRTEVVNGGCTEESFGTVRVEVVAEERQGAVGEKVAAVEGSVGGAASSASLETNCVGTGGEKIVALDGSGVAGVGAATETDVVGAGEGITAVEQMQGDSFYCHQCRQKRKGATPACKGGSKKKGKCLLKFCERCIRNRYSEIADQALNEEAWECPKCQNICNCSICMKNKEEVPMGPMVRPGRKRKGSVDDTPANKKPQLGAENGSPANKNLLLGAENTYAPKDHIDLPRGTLVTCVAGIELQPEDVGAAIQFLEFCCLFGEILEIREGQPEQTIKEITGGCQLPEVPSVVSDLHISLLSKIERGKAKVCKYPGHGDEWIRKVGDYFANSTLGANDLTLNCLNQGVSGYKNLTPSYKLDLLNRLCDEALSSEREHRESWAKEKIRAATKKEKLLQKIQKDLNKPMEGGETANNEKTENIISQIKEANGVRQSAMNELEELERALKATPIRLDNGATYWKLDGYCINNTNIMRQEFDDENTVKNKDKWFMFTEVEQKIIKDHLAKR
ncbi:hypothetical protein ACQ4PT_069938 [Festuca glaucescens]